MSNQIVDVFAEVVGGLDRNAQGSVVPVVAVANTSVTSSDRSILSACASDWSEG